nr:TolC family protein [uncultured Marinifilum sp.]
MIKKISFLLFLSIYTFCAVNAQEELSLSKAIQVGLENNYELKIFRKKEDISKLNNSWGAVGRYPSVKFNLLGQGNKNYNETSDYNSLSLIPSLDISWTLFDGFAVNIRKDKFDDLEKLSEGNTIVAIENKIELIILAYYKILLEKERLEVSRKIMDLSADRYEN